MTIKSTTYRAECDFDQADGGPVESPARADLPCGWTRFEMAVSGRSDARRLDVCPACLDKVTLKDLAIGLGLAREEA